MYACMWDEEGAIYCWLIVDLFGFAIRRDMYNNNNS